MNQIPQELQAQAALRCNAHARALMNFEKRLLQLQQEVPDSHLQDHYETMHQVYASLDEPDGMEGISSKIIQPSLLHQIREHETTGRWTAAQSCWELQLQSEPTSLDSHVGLLRCLRNLGHYGPPSLVLIC